MKNYCLPALMMLFLLSCKRDKDTTDSDPMIDPIPQFAVSETTFQPSSKFLKREISYTKGNPLLKQVRLFTYDNTNRCTEIRVGIIDSAQSNPAFQVSRTLTFSYTGASLLPASVNLVRSVFPNLVTTFYYNYNSQGRKIRDSVRVKNQAGEPADMVIHYQYEKDQVFATPVLRGFPMENNNLDTLSLLKGGNIEKLVSKTIKTSGDRMTTYTFTYDQFISPYRKMNIANSLYFEHPSIGIGYNVPKETHYMGVTINNMTSWTSGNYTATFQYQYNVDKYPLRKELYLPGDTEPYQVTLFEY
jgi:hypothetical protein